MLPRDQTTMSFHFPSHLAMTPVVSLDSQSQPQNYPVYQSQSHMRPAVPLASQPQYQSSEMYHHLPYPMSPVVSLASQSQPNYQPYPIHHAMSPNPAVSMTSQANCMQQSHVSSFQTPMQDISYTSTVPDPYQASTFSHIPQQVPPSTSSVQISSSNLSSQQAPGCSSPTLQSSSSSSGNPQQGGFIYVKNRKRNAPRKRDHSISSSSSTNTVVSKASKKKGNSTLLCRGNVPISNKYDVLQNLNADDENMNSDQEIVNVQEKIPPIIISKTSVPTLREFIDSLKVISADFTIKDTREFLNLQCNSTDTFRKFSTFLNNKVIEYHSFRLPTDKTIDVVIKNVPTSFDELEITTELESLGFKDFKLMRVWNREKKPIPVVNLYLEKKHSENKEIYHLTKLLNCIVYVEPKKKGSNVPQCSKCQRFGHTRNYCKQSPRCVYCSGAHSTAECQNKNVENAVPQCVNCKQNHTANYKGCKYYVDLKKKRFPDNRRLPAPNITHSTPTPPMSSFPPLARHAGPVNIDTQNVGPISSDHSYSRVIQQNYQQQFNLHPPSPSLPTSHESQPQQFPDASSSSNSIIDNLLSVLKPFFLSLLAKIKPLLQSFIVSLLNGSS